MNGARDPESQIHDSSLGQAGAAARLKSRRILVVGAGQRANEDADHPVGNGRAISMLFAREGASIACADRNAESAEATAKAIRANGATAIAIEADITDPAAIEPMLRASIAALGGLDGIVLNVGIASGVAFADMTAKHWDTVMSANLRGHMLTAQAGLRLLEPGSSIVFISSIAAHLPGGRTPDYETSKAGLMALARATALEGQPRGIRANVLSPGLIDTPLGRAASAARPNRAARALPFGRQGTAWEVAYAALFLVSAEASYVNATELVVDGGMLSGVARMSK